MSETSLARYDAARKALAEAKRTDDVLKVRDESERMRLYAKQAKDKTLEADASEIRLRAERRLGELIAAQKKSVGLNKGGGTGANQHKRAAGTKKEPAAPTLAEAGIDKKLSSRAQRLAGMSDQRFESVVEDARERVSQQTEKIATALSKPVTTKRTATAKVCWILRDALDRIAVVVDREVDQADADGRHAIGGYLEQRAHFLKREKTA